MRDTQNMPMMGMRYKSILRVALLRIFVFAGRIGSQSSPRTGRLKMTSLLDLRKGLDSAGATMRLETGGRREGTTGHVAPDFYYNLSFCQLLMVRYIGIGRVVLRCLCTISACNLLGTSPIRLSLSPRISLRRPASERRICPLSLALSK